MYAIVETGGKQYRVQRGQIIDVERLPVEVGQQVELDKVRFLAVDGEVTVGPPTVGLAIFRATVLRHDKARKIIVFKYKPKKRYRRKTGHRQHFTRLRIDEIVV